MKPALLRLTLAAIGFGLLLGGCARQQARPGEQPRATAESAPAPAESAAPTRAPSHRAATKTLPDSTGIPACDNYLSSYVACHRAAAIYKPEEIQGHYEAMRTSLLRDSQDARTRPQLATRCNSLAVQLREALHGKSCEGGAPASSSSSD